MVQWGYVGFSEFLQEGFGASVPRFSAVIAAPLATIALVANINNNDSSNSNSNNSNKAQHNNINANSNDDDDNTSANLTAAAAAAAAAATTAKLVPTQPTTSLPMIPTPTTKTTSTKTTTTAKLQLFTDSVHCCNALCSPFPHQAHALQTPTAPPPNPNFNLINKFKPSAPGSWAKAPAQRTRSSTSTAPTMPKLQTLSVAFSTR